MLQRKPEDNNFISNMELSMQVYTQYYDCVGRGGTRPKEGWLEWQRTQQTEWKSNVHLPVTHKDATLTVATMGATDSLPIVSKSNL